VLLWHSATSFSIIREIIIAPMAICLASLWWPIRKEKWWKWGVIKTLKDRSGDVLRTFFTIVLVLLALLVLVYTAAIPFVVYQDHMDVVAANQKLKHERDSARSERDAKQAENGELKSRILALEHQQAKVITKTLPVPLQSPTRPSEETISNGEVESWFRCSLRDPMRLPEDLMLYSPTNPLSYLEGSSGKAFLEALGGIKYQRLEQESQASVVQKFRLPENSDLIGKPLSWLKHYERLTVNASGADGKDFTSCDFFNVAFRVNGRDIYRTSEAIPEEKRRSLSPNQTPTIVLLFRPLELSE